MECKLTNMSPYSGAGIIPFFEINLALHADLHQNGGFFIYQYVGLHRGQVYKVIHKKISDRREMNFGLSDLDNPAILFYTTSNQGIKAIHRVCRWNHTRNESPFFIGSVIYYNPNMDIVSKYVSMFIMAHLDLHRSGVFCKGALF